MSRRKRSRRPAEGDAAKAPSKDAPIDPDVARFAARTFERQAAERDAKQAARDARRREDEHRQLIAGKDAAATEVKRLRTLEHTPAGGAAAADAAYRKALADLISFETGSPPAWAPAVEAADPAEQEPDEGVRQEADVIDTADGERDGTSPDGAG